MKNVIILHGTGSTPESYWHPYLKEELEAKGYQVSVPVLPGTEYPHLGEQLAFVLKNFQFNSDTILVGHSSGVPLILALLEKIDVTISRAMLVSGFFKPLPDNEMCKAMLPDAFNWDVIKQHCQEFVLMNSDNDPWGCNDVMGRELAEHLDGQFIFMKGEGHMGSGTFNQPYIEFPKLLELIHQTLPN